MTHTALGKYPTPHWVKSSIKSFPFSSYFSHDASLCFVLLLIFFLNYHLIHHAVLRWNFLEYFYDSLMSNCLQIPEMLLSQSWFPPYIKRLSCLRERTIRITLSSAFFSKVLSLTVLITVAGFVITSHQGLDHFDYIIGVCLYHISSITSA